MLRNRFILASIFDLYIINMKKIYIYCEPEACRRRKLDASKLSSYFSKNNYGIVKNPKEADLIFFITCSAVTETTNICLNKIKNFQKYEAELIVGGCLPVVDKDKLDGIFNGKTIGTKDLDYIDTLFPENKVKYKDLNDANILFENSNKLIFLKNITSKIRLYILAHIFGKYSYANFSSDRSQMHIRISWGCPNNCSYCTITRSTGTFHSKPIKQCLKEFKKGLQNNYHDFVITADNTGAYGIDIKSNFPELLNKINDIDGKYELIVRGLTPQWLVKYIGEYEKILSKKRIKIIEIPIQSGSKKILKLMRRFPEVEKIKESFKRLKSSYPDLKIFSHFIVGFPSEKIEDIQKTLIFIRDANIDSGQVFPFSVKKGTKAEKIEPKIRQKDIQKRMKFIKKNLRIMGYRVINLPKINSLLFDKKIREWSFGKK